MRCVSCHRVERASEVVVEGGARRPAGVPQRVALETLLASLRGDLAPVVGPCPACGQPMVGDGAREGYAIPVERGAVELRADGVLAGPDGPVSPDLARTLVRRAWPEPVVPVSERVAGVLGGLALALLLVPAAIALWMVFFVFWYMANLGASP